MSKECYWAALGFDLGVVPHVLVMSLVSVAIMSVLILIDITYECSQRLNVSDC